MAMANQRTTPPSEPDSEGAAAPSKRGQNGTRTLIDLEPGPDETVFRGIYPGLRDPDRA